jgi:hypothetical protein
MATKQEYKTAPLNTTTQSYLECKDARSGLLQLTLALKLADTETVNQIYSDLGVQLGTALETVQELEAKLLTLQEEKRVLEHEHAPQMVSMHVIIPITDTVGIVHEQITITDHTGQTYPYNIWFCDPDAQEHEDFHQLVEACKNLVQTKYTVARHSVERELKAAQGTLNETYRLVARIDIARREMQKVIAAVYDSPQTVHPNTPVTPWAPKKLRRQRSEPSPSKVARKLDFTELERQTTQ